MKIDLNVLVISDQASGGAAVSCSNLVRGLKFDHRVSVEWLAMSGPARQGVRIVPAWRRLSSLIKERLVLRLFGRHSPLSEKLLTRLTHADNERNMLAAIRRSDAQVLNLHNLHEMFSFDLVEELPCDKPIVWTLHDMWSLTGYCCYSFECDKYLTGCQGDCPQMGKWGTPVASPAVEWRRRERFYSANANRLVFVAPSRWLAECATRRLHGRIKVEHIPYSLDTSRFRPRNRAEVRRVLGLPEDRKIILFVADVVDNPRKGMSFLEEALNALGKTTVHPLAVAIGFRSGAPGAESKIDMVIKGALHDEELLSQYYASADVFVLPSLADNLPNTLLEAMACGTPCVTFGVGGCAEAIRDGDTGFVAKAGDAQDLANCIERILTLSPEKAEQFRRQCRLVAEKEYALEIQAQRYAQLFSEVASTASR